MPAAKSVWGIDVGQCALKALRLRYHNGQLEVQSFDVIEHAKILSQPDADEQQLIRTSLEKFLSRNDIRGSAVAISVPGQASFSRFIKLPPVDIRKVPEIVQYEARQQIPFDLDEVIWDHQVLSPPTAAPTELEVGIFAMKRDIVNDYVSDFLALRIEPDIVQMTPIALYNFFYFDKQEGPGATMILDMGAQNTNLIISDAERVWIRNIPMGGNNFTQALSKTFNLTFGKAEELKRHAAESKHGRKIFQAMRPVFADLLMEIQRSIGYYTSLHRESRIEHILALGNTFRVPGLTKFLSQGLGIEVMKFQGLNSLAESSKLNTPLFKENVLTFGTAFGLGIQGLGLGRIDTNLLPAGIRQQKVSRRKRPFFVAAAVSLLVALGCVGYSSLAARNALKGQAGAGDLMRQTVQGLIKENQKFSKRFDEERVEAVKALGQIAEVQQILDQRDYVYTLTRTVWDALPYDPRWLNWKPEEKDRIARGELEMVELLNVKIQYVSDVKDVIAKSSATAGHLDGMSMESPMPTVVKNSSLQATTKMAIPAMVVTIEGIALRKGRQGGRRFINDRLVKKLTESPYTMKTIANPVKHEGEDFKRRPEYKKSVIGTSSGRTSGGGRRGAAAARARVAAETGTEAVKIDKGNDWWFKITWICSTSSSVPMAEDAETLVEMAEK